MSISFLRARKDNLIKSGRGCRREYWLLKLYFYCSAFHHFATFCAKRPSFHYFINISIIFLVKYFSHLFLTSKLQIPWGLLDRYQLNQQQFQLVTLIQGYTLVTVASKKKWTWQPYENSILKKYYQCSCNSLSHTHIHAQNSSRVFDKNFYWGSYLQSSSLTRTGHIAFIRDTFLPKGSRNFTFWLFFLQIPKERKWPSSSRALKMYFI